MKINNNNNNMKNQPLYLDVFRLFRTVAVLTQPANKIYKLIKLTNNNDNKWK